MGNRMRGNQGMRGMFTRIWGNILEDSGAYSHFSIPGNAQEDSGQCARRFPGMFGKILRNVPENSGECLRRFQGMFKKIPGNVQEDSGKSKSQFMSRNLACLLSSFAVKLLQNNGKKQLLSNSPKENIFFTATCN